MTESNRALKARQVPPAALAESLLQKSKQYAKRALGAKHTGDVESYQLYAALAFELLAKASLASIHPSLVVKTDNTNSLLEVNGISTGTVIRTIDANEAYARLRHTVTGYTSLDMDASRKLADRRNAELHSGEPAFASFPPNLWEGEFWHAAELVLGSMKLSLDDWLGADAKAPKEQLSALRKARASAVELRIARARVGFAEFKPDGKKKRTKKSIQQIVDSSKHLDPAKYRHLFKYLTEREWLAECPACGAHGVVGGDKVFEESADDQSEAEPGFEYIEIGYYPLEFHCPTCGLELVGPEEVVLGGISEDGYSTLVEREIQFEPDYGND